MSVRVSKGICNEKAMYLRGISSDQPIPRPDNGDSFHLSGALGLLRIDAVGGRRGVRGEIAAVPVRGALFRAAANGVVTTDELTLLTQTHTG
jgi:hypothetical protein